MTQNEKLIALAELDGWKFSNEDHDENGNLNFAGLYHPTKKGGRPPYLTSRDALQPLLEKMTDEEWMRFATIATDDPNLMEMPFARFYLTMKCERVADIILKACGKWKE